MLWLKYSCFCCSRYVVVVVDVYAIRYLASFHFQSGFNFPEGLFQTAFNSITHPFGITRQSRVMVVVGVGVVARVIPCQNGWLCTTVDVVVEVVVCGVRKPVRKSISVFRQLSSTNLEEQRHIHTRIYTERDPSRVPSEFPYLPFGFIYANELSMK